MRLLILITILILGLYKPVFSDAGHCAKYDVELQLIDGQKISGTVYVLTSELRFQFKEISFLEYLKRNNSPDTLYVYKNIRQLKFPNTSQGINQCHFYFNATTKDNEFKILKKTIKTARLISYSICNNCDNPDEKNGYYWNGIYPTIITELMQTEIDLLETTPIATVNFGHNIRNNTDRYWLISYSQKYKETDLEDLKNEFLFATDKLLKTSKWSIVQVKYEMLKNELRKKNVILFKTAEVF